MQAAVFDVTVPGGRWTGGALVRDFQLRPLTAADAITFLDNGPPATSLARTVTVLLARCAEISEVEAAELTVGDREALLLQLRRLTLGATAPCVLTCPRANCGAKMDLDLRLTDLLLPPYAEARHSHEATFMDSDNGACWTISFRLPTGADQEAVAGIVRLDEQGAVDLILKRCVQRRLRNGVVVADLSDAITRQVAERMEALDPQAEIVLQPRCPSCGEMFQAVYDAAACFLAEMAVRTRALLGEVHLLASAYHWSEAAILALPDARRRRYLDLIAASGRAMA